MNKYISWFVSAIKSSKLNDEIDNEMMLTNCKSCFSQVRKTMKSNEEDSMNMFEDFKERSTFILMLSSSTVRPHLEKICNVDTANMLKSVPAISFETCTNVIISFKFYKFLRRIFPSFSTSLICEIHREFSKCKVEIVPIRLAINFEMLIGVVLSLEWDFTCVNEILNNFFVDYINILKRKKFNFDIKEEINLFGFLYLYISESFNILLSCFLRRNDYIPSTLGKSFLKDINYSSGLVISNDNNFIINFMMKELLNLLFINMQHISTSIWIEWHSIECPITCLYSSELSHIFSKTSTIQKLISFSSHNLIQFSRDHLEIANLLLTDYETLSSFFNSISVDPSHDPDVDLSIEELIDLIHNNESRQKKAIGILISSREVFYSIASLECIHKNQALLEDKPECILTCLQNLVETITSNNDINEDWKRVVLGLAKNLDSLHLFDVIKHSLSNGSNDCLKTSDFLLDVTHVFNQVAASNNEKSKLTNLYFWLCLQSGLDVVHQSINIITSMSGLTSIIVSALRQINFICRRKDSNLSFLVGVLKQSLLSNLSDAAEKEIKELCIGLLTPVILTEDEDGAMEKVDSNIVCSLPLDPAEVMLHVVQPLLRSTNTKGLNSNINIAVDILNVIAKYHFEILMIKGPNMSALIMTLSLLYNNCCYLTESNIQNALPIRVSVQKLIERVLSRILSDEQFHDEVLLFNNILIKYPLNIRCEILISSLDASNLSDEIMHIDQLYKYILLCLINPEMFGNNQNIISKFLASNKIKRKTWIFLMYSLLPNSNETEWLNSIFLNNLFLSSCSANKATIITSLELTSDVLVLISKAHEKFGDEEDPICLHHCFKSFSGACLKFIHFNTNNMEARRKFITLQEIFIWWCCCLSITTFKNKPDLPLIFLLALVNEMNEIVHSGSIKTSLGVREDFNLNGDSKSLQYHFDEEIRSLFLEETTYSEDDISLPKLVSTLSRSIKYFNYYSINCKVSASVANKLKSIYKFFDEIAIDK